MVEILYPRFSQYFCQHCEPYHGNNIPITLLCKIGYPDYFIKGTLLPLYVINETVHRYCRGYPGNDIEFTAILRCVNHPVIECRNIKELLECNQCRKQVIYYRPTALNILLNVHRNVADPLSPRTIPQRVP